MSAITAYSTAYPGSMSVKVDGDYIERTDAASLAGALSEQIATLKREADDFDAALHALAADNAALRATCDELLAALLDVARRAEALKRPCGMDPESAQAIRNSQYMSLSYAARAAISKAEATK